jgi:uncharacterized protein YxeA
MKKKQIIIGIVGIIIIILCVVLIINMNKNTAEENKQNINVETKRETSVNGLEENAGTFSTNEEDGRAIQVEE